jgi:hypothetical protein
LEHPPSVPKGQQFMSMTEVTAKEMTATKRYRKIVSRNVSKSFTNIGKSVSLPKGTTLKQMLCK